MCTVLFAPQVNVSYTYRHTPRYSNIHVCIFRVPFLAYLYKLCEVPGARVIAKEYVLPSMRLHVIDEESEMQKG